MIFSKRNKKWMVIALLVLALVPVLIMAFEVVITKDSSVTVLENYHPQIVFLIFSYYTLLGCWGLYWLVRKIIFINRLKNEKTKAELQLLKNQVSPHFFFNMLNNLYGLVVSDSHKAQQLILKLSDMMRYSIYEGGKDEVTLQDEVDFLKNYIELHKMRYHKYIDIAFKYEIEADIKISPLLYIILVENAFKHGVENLRENAYVKISLTSSEKEIRFSIANNYKKATDVLGIGLDNLQRRLELIYPDQHKLSFSITETVFEAELILQKP